MKRDRRLLDRGWNQLISGQRAGVVGKIIYFNHPFTFAASKIAAPLIAGNIVVLKHPEGR